MQATTGLGISNEFLFFYHINSINIIAVEGDISWFFGQISNRATFAVVSEHLQMSGGVWTRVNRIREDLLTQVVYSILYRIMQLHGAWRVLS